MVIRIFQVTINPEYRNELERDFKSISIETVKNHKGVPVASTRNVTIKITFNHLNFLAHSHSIQTLVVSSKFVFISTSTHA